MKEFRKLGDELNAKNPLGGLKPVDHLPGNPLPYGCEKCDGYGNIIDETGARPCQCKLEYFRQRQLGFANIPKKFRRMTLESFKRETRSQKNVYSTIKLYADRYSADNNKGLLLWGGPGSGKTHLAVAVLQELIGKGFTGVYYNTLDLLRQIKRSFDPRNPSAELPAIRESLNLDILLLDDLGASRITGWELDEIYAIINHRYEADKTLILTMQDFDALAERVGEAVYSRLLEMCVVKECGDEDYRETHLAEQLSVDDIA